MLLSSVKELREILGFEEMLDIETAIRGALNAAEPVLASALNTSFERRVVKDTFWVPRPPVLEGSHRKTEFWLSNGFLSEVPEVEGYEVAAEAIRVDLEKGIVRDHLTYYTNAHVSFTYVAGFDVDEDVEGSYLLKDVPAWLQEASRVQALIFLSNSEAINEAGMKIDASMLKEQLVALLNTRIRYAPMALLPV